ncbi:MAG: hypothetical protein R2795_15365 [Saprospiraceae bacterium]
MVGNLLNAQLQTQRAQLEEVIKDLHELTILIGNEEMSQTLSELRNRLHDPFMFVIVGEVKAGKSSFVNALLATGEDHTGRSTTYDRHPFNNLYTGKR